jgi:hypothetical protein
MSDYGEEHRMLKKLAMTNLLGLNTQVTYILNPRPAQSFFIAKKRRRALFEALKWHERCLQNKNRSLREEALLGMVDGVLAELNGFPKSTGVVNVREHIQRALFPFAMIQVNDHAVALQNMCKNVHKGA